MKKKIILMSVAAVLALTAVIGGTMAAFNGSSKDGKAMVTTKQLNASFTQTINEEITPLGENGKAKIREVANVPGQVVEMPVGIVNDVNDGYDLYAKVTINKAWYNGEEKEYNLDPSKIIVNTVDPSNWIIQMNDDQEQMVFIYKLPIKANEITASNFMDSISLSSDIGNSYANHEVVLEMTIDAVQAANAKEGAVLSAWGIELEFGDNGEIVKILE